MKHLKRVLAVLLAAIALFSFTSCDKEDPIETFVAFMEAVTDYQSLEAASDFIPNGETSVTLTKETSNLDDFILYNTDASYPVTIVSAKGTISRTINESQTEGSYKVDNVEIQYTYNEGETKKSETYVLNGTKKFVSTVDKNEKGSQTITVTGLVVEGKSYQDFSITYNFNGDSNPPSMSATYGGKDVDSRLLNR